jgi:hypothetical protein
MLTSHCDPNYLTHACATPSMHDFQRGPHTHMRHSMPHHSACTASLWLPPDNQLVLQLIQTMAICYCSSCTQLSDRATHLDTSTSQGSTHCHNALILGSNLDVYRRTIWPVLGHPKASWHPVSPLTVQLEAAQVCWGACHPRNAGLRRQIVAHRASSSLH